jgi:hypothetical protein
MTLQFITLAAIDTRLKQRLQMGGTQAAFGKTVITDADTTQIAEQVEGRVRMRLKSKYQLPLNLTDTDAQKALASIVEKLTICDILAPNFMGAEPSDEGGYIRSEFCTQGAKELEDLMKSYIDGEVAIGVSIGAANRAPSVGARSGGTVVSF